MIPSPPALTTSFKTARRKLLGFLILVPLLATSLPAAEIATGFMLGGQYDPRAFYVRNSPADRWEKTYAGPAYRPEAQGKLMNIRLANALFLDEWMRERPFDPEFNTDAVIQALDFYKNHGVLMINVSLQARRPVTIKPSTASTARTPIAWVPAAARMSAHSAPMVR